MFFFNSQGNFSICRLSFGCVENDRPPGAPIEVCLNGLLVSTEKKGDARGCTLQVGLAELTAGDTKHMNG